MRRYKTYLWEEDSVIPRTSQWRNEQDDEDSNHEHNVDSDHYLPEMETSIESDSSAEIGN